MALLSSANYCNNTDMILVPSNRILIHPLGFPSLLTELRRNPTLNHRFKLLSPSKNCFNHDPYFTLRHSGVITASAISSSSSPDVVEVDRDNTSSCCTSSTTVSSEWLEFARNVSGEWDGYGADFSSTGKPIELPESVVPEAYREWEVKVFDWQTQCPTLAQLENYALFYKSINLLPTVGCEADAATRYSVDERIIGGAESCASAFAYQPSGCYAAVWLMEDHSTYRLLELEHCLFDPRNKESRVRIIQVVRVENNKFMLRNIKVFCEQWYGPFRNGDQLGGCAIRDSAFATTEPLEDSEVTGVWQGLHAVASFQNSWTNVLQQLLLDDSVRKSVRDERNLVLLPKQLWSSLEGREHGETCCEVGWLFEQGQAITSKCIFSPDAELKEIAIAQETETAMAQ